MEILDIVITRTFNIGMLQHIEFQHQHSGKISIIQLTDSHISADKNELFAGVDTTDTLSAVIAAVNRHENIDVVLMTGDLVHTPSVGGYEKLAELLTRLEPPVFCLPGNHDDPLLMRRLLNTGNISTANFLTSGPWTIILLNTHQPGKEGGYLSEAELSRLDEALERSADKHALICLHHHPVSIHSPWMDAMRLKNSEAFFQTLDRHVNVKGVIWGHIHQEFTATRNNILLLGSPSTCIQFAPRSEEFQFDASPPAYRTLSLNKNGKIQTRIYYQGC